MSSSSWSQIALIMENKPDIDQTDIDDLYNNLRVYEDEMKRSSSSTSNSQNLAFLSSENSCCIKGAEYSLKEDKKELGISRKTHFLPFEGRKSRWSTRALTGNNDFVNKLIMLDGHLLLKLSSYSDNEDTAHTRLDEMSNKSETDSEISMSVFEVRSSDEEITPANDRFSKVDGYHAVPPPITGNFLTPRADISFAGQRRGQIVWDNAPNKFLQTELSRSFLAHEKLKSYSLQECRTRDLVEIEISYRLLRSSSDTRSVFHSLCRHTKHRPFTKGFVYKDLNILGDLVVDVTSGPYECPDQLRLLSSLSPFADLVLDVDIDYSRDLERGHVSISLNKGGRRKKSKPKSTLDDSTIFNDHDHGMKYMETKEAMDEGRQSGETEEVKYARPDIDAARQEDSAVEPRTPPTQQELAEMEREREERQRQDQAFVDYIASLYDEVQAKMDASEELASRTANGDEEFDCEPERMQKFVPIGSKRDEKMIDKMNKKAAGMDEEEVSESTKVEVKKEGHEENIRKRSGRRLKMKATKKSKRQKTNSDLEEEDKQELI
ncbi:hypothetical protein Tco_0352175 [Tanacetum coccineum]